MLQILIRNLKILKNFKTQIPGVEDREGKNTRISRYN
jgi:hypothetical protein